MSTLKTMTGQLTEISPWGTGFVADTTGAFYGFHYSMITGGPLAMSVNWSRILEGRPVNFQLKDGSVSQIEIEGQTQAQEVQTLVAVACERKAAVTSSKAVS